MKITQKKYDISKEPYIDVMSSNGQCMIVYNNKAWPVGNKENVAMFLAAKLTDCDNANFEVRDNNLYVTFKTAKGKEYFSIKDCAVKQTINTDMSESVNHPSHYGGDTVYEAIKVIEAWGLNFHVGNTVKYCSRAGKKDPAKAIEDLKKARWYLDREIENREKEAANGNAQPETQK